MPNPAPQANSQAAMKAAGLSFWQELLQILETALLTNAGPDVLAFLQWYETNGLNALFTPAGQAELMKVEAALLADAMNAGNDVTQQLASMLIAWLQGFIASNTSSK